MYIIWFLRRIVPLMLAQIVFLVVFLKLLADKVFFGKVIENAALASGSNYWEFFKYLLSAFLQAHFIVQLFIIFILGVGTLFLRDIGRAVANYLKTLQR